MQVDGGISGGAPSPSPSHMDHGFEVVGQHGVTGHLEDG